MLKEVQYHIDIINQKEAFAVSDETKQLVNEAMQDIRFNFSKIGEEEMKMIAGGVSCKTSVGSHTQVYGKHRP